MRLTWVWGRGLPKLLLAWLGAIVALTAPELGVFSASAEATLRPYTIAGVRYTPARDDDYARSGVASWYGPGFHGRATASGERFDRRAMTAAHPTLPVGTRVAVTNLATGAQVELRINDRGPFSRGRIIDVSEAAAEALGFKRQGVARVRVENVTGARRARADVPPARAQTPDDAAPAALSIAASEPGVADEASAVRTAWRDAAAAADGLQVSALPEAAVLVSRASDGVEVYSLGVLSDRAAADDLAARFGKSGRVSVHALDVAGHAAFQVILAAASTYVLADGGGASGGLGVSLAP